MIVVDTNVIAYVYFPGPFTAAAVALLQCDSDWAAPLLWRSELRNALSLYLRKHLLTLARAFEIQTAAETLIGANEYQIESDDVLRLAEQSGCSAYDCEYVSLARLLGIPLFTSDKKLLRAFPNVAVSLSVVADS